MKYENGSWVLTDPEILAAYAKERENHKQAVELVKQEPTAKRILELWPAECRDCSLDDLEELINAALTAKQAALLARVDSIVAAIQDETNLPEDRLSWHGKEIDAVWINNQLQAVRWMLGAPMPEWTNGVVPEWLQLK